MGDDFDYDAKSLFNEELDTDGDGVPNPADEGLIASCEIEAWEDAFPDDASEQGAVAPIEDMPRAMISTQATERILPRRSP